MTQRALLAALSTAAAVAGAGILGGPTASAGVATAGCALGSGILTIIDPDGGPLSIQRSGTNIAISDPNSLNCTNGPPTINNTNRIDISGTGNYANAVTINFSQGAFAPGAQDEGDGGSEIEFHVDLDLDGTTGDSLELNQIPDATAGTAGINLNPVSEAADEVDMTNPAGTAAPSSVESFVATGAAGGTYFAANGDSAAGGNFPYPVTFYGSSDTDTVFGSDADDVIAGQFGNDVLTGGLGNDTLQGNEGIDKLKAKDGVKDTKINCGPGKNRKESARVDSKDPTPKSC